MFRGLYGKYDWVLVPLVYPDSTLLIDKLEEPVVVPALEKYRK
jgi:hypothetical protein